MKDVQGFKDFLKDVKGHSDKGVNSRISLIHSIENNFDLNIDNIVKDDNETFRLLNLIKKSKDYNGNKQNAVRAYYEYINKKEFPRLNEYSLSKIKVHIKYKHQVSIKDFANMLSTINQSFKDENLSQFELNLKDEQIKLNAITSGSFWVQIGLPILINVVSSLLSALIETLCKKLNKKKKKYKITFIGDNCIEIEEL